VPGFVTHVQDGWEYAYDYDGLPSGGGWEYDHTDPKSGVKFFRRRADGRTRLAGRDPKSDQIIYEY